MNAPLKSLASFEATPLPRRAIVSFRGVSKTFSARGESAEVAALSGIQLDVPAGSVLGVIGRSGAGKSTLIRLVNGLETPTSGEVFVDGVDVAGLPEKELRVVRRSTGMIFQHFNLLALRTVFDNVALPLEIAGERPARIKAKVEPLLELVGLADKRDRYPVELSGGQKQRVGIARALATDPKVLLSDEATSALDPETTRSILALMAQVNAELGVSILLITHEMQVVKEICHRVAVLEAGRIVEEGEAFEVLTGPRHAVTASFVAAVTGVELPQGLVADLRPEPVAGGRAVLRIVFAGENATAPVVSRLTSVLGIDVNILAGRIDSIRDRPFGTLVVAVPGDPLSVSAALGALDRLDLKAEVIGHVP